MVGLLEFLTTILKTIPIIRDLFKKSEVQEEQDARKDVDQEMTQNEQKGRPSGQFWDKRHL